MQHDSDGSHDQPDSQHQLLSNDLTSGTNGLLLESLLHTLAGDVIPACSPTEQSQQGSSAAEAAKPQVPGQGAAGTGSATGTADLLQQQGRASAHDIPDDHTEALAAEAAEAGKTQKLLQQAASLLISASLQCSQVGHAAL